MENNNKVCLRIDGINHHLCKYKNYRGGGKGRYICPNCSLYNTHFSYCWDVLGEPICSSLAQANAWDNDFEVYFKTMTKKLRVI